MLQLVPVVKILKKAGVTGKIWEKVEVKLLRDLTKKSIILVLWQISPIGEKNIHHHRSKTRENDNFSTKQSSFLSPNFIRESTVIVIPNNVEFCKQYFLREYLLLIRKSCN